MARTQRRIRTAIRTEFEVGGRSGKGKITNVAEGGLFVGTASIPEQGETVELRFSTPSGRRLAVSGLVWWTTAQTHPDRYKLPGFGLRLLEESDDYDRFVRSLTG
jgi:Tfp pilus assembly protein PilZ